LKKILLLLACCAFPAFAQFVPKSDWEEKQDRLNWKEGQVTIPAWPRRERLIEFFVTNMSSFRFYVDADSLAVAPDGVILFTLVARSGSGVENVTYEGMRCDNGRYAVFAHGNDGQWRRVPSEWKVIEAKAFHWRNTLRSDIFCPGRAGITTAAEGVAALRQGYHPALRVIPNNPAR
jgi:hypothetical protein